MKQWWHETYILPSELRAPNMQALWSLRHFFFFLFFAPCPLNNKTVVENKAYNIPGGVLKLMTPKTGSVHTKNNHLWKGGWPSNTKDCHCFSKVPWQFWPDHIWGKKTSLPYLGEELMMETWHLLKKDKDLLPFPLPSSDLKNVTHWGPRAAQCLIPACEPHKHPILINHFLSSTLPLAEFFLALRQKGLWCQSSLEPLKDTKWFQSLYLKIWRT